MAIPAYTGEGGVDGPTSADWFSMLKVVVLAAAVGALVLVATGRVDDLRSQIGLRENPFDAINAALEDSSQRAQQQMAWNAFARKTNSICTDHEKDELGIRLALPRNRADFARALGTVLDRERTMQAELRALQPAPPNYSVSYSKFLRDRQAGLAALARMQRAAKENKRKDFILAARAILRRKATIDAYVRSAGMPACIF
jgi:hypothetical protein